VRSPRALVSRAVRAGASEAEVIRISRRTKETSFERNSLKSVQADESEAWGIRLLRGKKVASASTNDPTRLDEMVEEAARIAESSEEDPYAGLPTPAFMEQVAELCDPRQVSLAEVLEAAVMLVDAARKVDRRVSVDSAGVTHTRTRVEIVSSTGIDAAEETTCASAFIFGMAADGEEVSSCDYVVDEEVCWEALAGRLAHQGQRFAQAVLSALGAQPADTFRGYALLGPEVTADIVGALEFLVSARSVQEGRSRFAGKRGTPVAAAALTLADQPRIPGSPRSRSFDREGVPTRPLTVIEQGVLRSFLYDTRTARKDGVFSTGHAAGGLSGQPSPAFHSPRIQGTAPLGEMVRMIDRGVRVRRFSGNLNPVSGVFSGLVKGGHLIREGAPKTPLTDTMINATLDGLLGGIAAVSYETEPTGYGHLPWLLVKGMDIIGRED